MVVSLPDADLLEGLLHYIAESRFIFLDFAQARYTYTHVRRAFVWHTVRRMLLKERTGMKVRNWRNHNLLPFHMYSLWKGLSSTLVLYWCKTWSLILRQDKTLNTFQKKLKRRIFASKKEVTWERERIFPLYAASSSESMSLRSTNS